MYSREIEGQTFRFGVSGLLYKSNVLMYDQQTESLWSQILHRAVTGPKTGKTLRRLPSTLTTWAKWKKKHPKTKVLSPGTGHVRDYTKDPYEDYYASRSGLFGFLKGGLGAEEKELAVGIEIEVNSRAYRLAMLRENNVIIDSLGQNKLTLSYDNQEDQLTVTDQAGQSIPHIILYWFVWNSIYPSSDVYSVK